MKDVFSLRTLTMIGTILLSLVTLYVILLIAPYLKPLWSLFKTVAIPYITSMIFAYLLSPVVHSLMKFHFTRSQAILVLFIGLIGLLGAIIWYCVPVFISQMKELIEELPAIEWQIRQWFRMVDVQMQQLPDGIHHAADDAFRFFELNLMQSVEHIVLSAGGRAGNLIPLLVVPFLVFYMLYDAQVLQKALRYFIPALKRKPAVLLWRDIDHSLGEYIRGQVTVSAIVGMLAAIGYYLIGLPYSLFLAFFVGFTNIMAYFGPFIGAGPAVVVALITEPELVLWVIVVYAVIQIMEGNVLGPNIVGKRLHIHPIFIILALLIGAELGGVIGLILAVPVFVVLKVIILNTALHLRRYKSLEKDRSEPAKH
jgi:predicted PurR-regulated permease PerM